MPSHLPPTSPQPVTCLGYSFADDQARLNYFLDQLRYRLTDPQWQNLSGGPQATVEAILALSDPPYYTVGPNPWVTDCLQEWDSRSKNVGSDHRESLFSEVTDDKNDPIYRAHPYPIKVSYQTIMRYILHYTEPYEIVYDGFCGAGMTGVAAQSCGDRVEVEKLGYRVSEDNTLWRRQEDEKGILYWQPFSKLGPRRAVLNDPSPLASLLAYHYNTPVTLASFQQEAEQILQEVETECQWFYQTLHSCRKTPAEHAQEIESVLLGEATCPYWLTVGQINYMVWSDVLLCSQCSGEIVFWEATAGQAQNSFNCPHCQAYFTRSHPLQRAMVTVFDQVLQQTLSQVKQLPVLINYSVNTVRFEKSPDAFDFAVLKKTADLDIPYPFPIYRINGGNENSRLEVLGRTHLHHFYTPRNLWTLAAVWQKSATGSQRQLLRLWITSTLLQATQMCQFTSNRQSGKVAGTLYLPPLVAENNVLKLLRRKLQEFLKIRFPTTRDAVISCASREKSLLPDHCMDYIFVAPPVGSQVKHSELNCFWEAWLQVFTPTPAEAGVNQTTEENLSRYRQLMTQTFQEAFRLLKPGHWLTVAFSGTQATLWHLLQATLQEVGLVLAKVSTLSKKPGALKAVTSTATTRPDLIISAYKPSLEFEEQFTKLAGAEAAVWEFIRHHLTYLPVCHGFTEGQLEFMVEREPRLLYDRLLAYFLSHGYPVPLSSQAFQTGLSQHFFKCDGMIFLAEQAEEYEIKRLLVAQPPRLEILVCDEFSAIEWLRQTLHERPSSSRQLRPEFMKRLGTRWKKSEVCLELEELLEQNFLKYDGTFEVPRPIHRYLLTQSNAFRHLELDDPLLQQAARERWYVPDPPQAQALEKSREKQLLKEFESYRHAGKRYLQPYRSEAIRAGFKKAWADGELTLIIEMAERLPETVLQEDEKLLLWYTTAMTRMRK